VRPVDPERGFDQTPVMVAPTEARTRRRGRGRDGCLREYLAVVSEWGYRPGNTLFHLRYLFDGVDFDGKVVLDVGAGNGWSSLYAACMGATRVVGLEPEAAGSSESAQAQFEHGIARIGLDQVELIPETFQDYDPGDTSFDVVLLMSAINHLDEEATARLHLDPEARSIYRELFEKLASLCGPGAKLIVADCARLNLFPRLGITNPIAPWIEWHKHQQPEFWSRLLEAAGFERPRIRWSSFNTLRTPGRLLLGNRFAAYCLTSTFCLTMQRSGLPVAHGER
jgi:SAM-dependent methyltransferase